MSAKLGSVQRLEADQQGGEICIGSEAGEMRLPNFFGTELIHHLPQVLDMKVQDLVFSMEVYFSFVLLLTFLYDASYSHL